MMKLFNGKIQNILFLDSYNGYIKLKPNYYWCWEIKGDLL